jgi:hypothetical protein
MSTGRMRHSVVDAILCNDGSVNWSAEKIGLWWKDDFRGYNFAPFDDAQAKVTALTKAEFRTAVSANVREIRSIPC